MVWNGIPGIGSRGRNDGSVGVRKKGNDQAEGQTEPRALKAECAMRAH